MKLSTAALTLTALALCAGCGPTVNHNQAVYVLVDTSGTYTKEVNKAQGVVNYLLGSLEPGDSVAVATIKSRSFSEKDIVAKVSLTKDPIQVNSQKKAFSEKMAQFAHSTQNAKGTAYTDITGGLLQAVEFLNEKQPGRKTIFIFSDLKEDLQAGYVRDIEVPVDGFEVVALNVTKLRSDNVDPREYLARLDEWKHRVESEGGTWRVINDLDRLETLL